MTVRRETSSEHARFSGGTLLTGDDLYDGADALSESHIVTGGEAGGFTLKVTLDGGAQWNATLGESDEALAALRAGFASAQTEATGWNAIVQPAITVARTSDTVLTFTLPASPAYDISAPETLTLQLPPDATSLGHNISLPARRLAAARST